jgi:hypothetical protein
MTRAFSSTVIDIVISFILGLRAQAGMSSSKVQNRADSCSGCGRIGENHRKEKGVFLLP